MKQIKFCKVKEIKSYLRYYRIYHKLFLLHNQIFTSNNVPDVPTLWSQDICRILLHIDKYAGSLYDGQKVINGNIETYEIKATCLPNQNSTMSTQANPDHLLWVMVDPIKNYAIIYEMNVSLFLNCLNNSSNRNSIYLSPSKSIKELIKIDFKKHKITYF